MTTWFHDEVFLPRILRSFFWMLLIQLGYINVFFLFLKILSWSPMFGFEGWFLSAFQLYISLYNVLLSVLTSAFVTIHESFYTVERYVCANRYEKVCRCFSAHQLQHILKLSVLGGAFSYFWMGLQSSYISEHQTLLEKCFILEDGLEQAFVVSHGFYTGAMFSLQYLICNMQLLAFSLSEEPKALSVQRSLVEIVSESFFGVLKLLHWHYVFFALLAPWFQHIFPALDIPSSSVGISYKLLNVRLFATTLLSGFMICFTWRLYICIFNVFAIERYKFLIEAPITGIKNKLLCNVLHSDDPLLKYLAVLDLRLLSQNDPIRRQQFFAISQPGGNPYQWKALSEFCITSLEKFHNQLNEFTLSALAPKIIPKPHNVGYVSVTGQIAVSRRMNVNIEKLQAYVQEMPAVAYFLEELPNAKIMKLFVSCQPIIWTIEALGFLVCASYEEDKFGVVQQTLKQIICLLLDLNMAEEKLPMTIGGIRSNVRDPQGRYDHVHYRLNFKSAVNLSLSRIAATFEDYVSGIRLPEEYYRYFLRYLSRKNVPYSR